jgi:hypothetical protein
MTGIPHVSGHIDVGGCRGSPSLIDGIEGIQQIIGKTVVCHRHCRLQRWAGKQGCVAGLIGTTSREASVDPPIDEPTNRRRPANLLLTKSI